MLDSPWTQPSGVNSVVQRWQNDASVQRCLAAERLMLPKEARWVPVFSDLHPKLRQALRTRGITSLYSHQAQAIGALFAGRSVVIATPTASGKSLCFHLPVVSSMLDHAGQSALFLYPTKALSRDQEQSLLNLIQEADLPITGAVYDGDTPGDARRKTREHCRLLLTNPDMLHSGILPQHARWARFFRGLRYVVLDELHTYRGVFGSHMAHVLWRLRRIARFHGADPLFICATATIGNPLEHAARLLSIDAGEIELVDESGAPQAGRRVFLYNPPVVNQKLGLRKSTLKETVRLTADLVRARVPTIVFGPSRNSVEVMLKYLRERCADVAGDRALMAYRGGYLPEERRRIERGLRNGEILCVVATNALELGIDLGDLDAVVCAGYPGSVAGLWQRFGRAGRRGSDSIALLVCSSHALDQYVATEPESILGANPEHARIDPGNTEILIQHLKCAAFEAPFELSARGPRVATPKPAAGESYLSLDAQATRDALDFLVKHGLLCQANDRYHWASDAFPANHVSLRSVGWDNFVIIDQQTDKSIGELDFRAAHTMLHEQAIYQQDAEQYQVERLDYDNHKAYVRKVEPDYFTTALSYRSVGVLEQKAQEKLGLFRIGWGEVNVVEKVTGYKKVKFFTHENAGYGDVFLPEIELFTVSFWLTLPDQVLSELFLSDLGVDHETVVDGLRGLGAALKTRATLELMCDPRDLHQTLGDGPAGNHEAIENEARIPLGRDPLSGHTGKFDPTLFLFDAQPGGVGLAERVYERARELLQAAARLIQICPCQHGCPACVGPTLEGGGRKQPALSLLGALRLSDGGFPANPDSKV